MPKDQSKLDQIFTRFPAITTPWAALRSLSQLHLSPVQDEIRASRQAGAAQLARCYVALTALKDASEAVSKQIDQMARDVQTRDLPEAMEAEGLTNVPLVEGFQVVQSNLFRASIEPDRKAEALDWLRENGLGDLIFDTVNASALSSAFRHKAEEENQDPPSELFRVFVAPTVSVRSTPSKK